MKQPKVKFYWESQREQYNFKPYKNYLFYYPGCFCPPHRGHFNTIADFKNLPNAKFIIHQGGSERRHGVPYELNKKIWRIYIKELLPADKFSLVKKSRDLAKDLEYHQFVREADTVVFIAGNESYDPSIHERYSSKIKYRKRFEKLVQMGKEIIFLFLDRPKLNTLSATKLIETVRRNRRSAYDSRTRSNIIRPFLPENLSDKGVRYISRKLEECDKLH